MIHRAMIGYYAREASLLFASLAAIVFAFGWIRVWLVGQLDTSTFAKILELLPKDVRNLSPVDQTWLITYDGRIAFTFSEPLVTVAASAWAITRASDVVSGQLGRGTLEMVLSQPVSRLQMLGSHTLVTIVGGVLLAIALWCGMWAGIQTVTATESVYPPLKILGIPTPVENVWAKPKPVTFALSREVDASTFLPAVRHLIALTVMIAGLTTAASCCDRQRWRTIGIGSGFLIVAVLTKMIGKAIPWLAWLRFTSIFTLYEPELMIYTTDRYPESLWSVMAATPWNEAVGPGGPLGYDLAMLALGASGLLVGAIVFQRRDLPAPI